jgi:hypothetical protein
MKPKWWMIYCTGVAVAFCALAIVNRDEELEASEKGAVVAASLAWPLVAPALGVVAAGAGVAHAVASVRDFITE